MDDGKKGLIKIGLIVFTLLYIISPVDLMPGLPIDDIVVLILHFFIQNRLSQRDYTNPVVEKYNTYAEDIIDSQDA